MKGHVGDLVRYRTKLCDQLTPIYCCVSREFHSFILHSFTVSFTFVVSVCFPHREVTTGYNRPIYYITYSHLYTPPNTPVFTVMLRPIQCQTLMSLSSRVSFPFGNNIGGIVNFLVRMLKRLISWQNSCPFYPSLTSVLSSV
jgi:hypothetical protein